MTSKCPIAGYSFGEDSVPPSPVSLEELRKLEAATGWSDDDALWLKIAGETLIPQAEAIVDSWRSVIGRLPQLAASFVGPDGKPDEHYKAAIKLRFVQWVSDVCLQPHDQRWLDYQEEIGQRHMPAKKNRTDNAQTPSVVPQRYLLAFTAIVITTIGGFLAESGERFQGKSRSALRCGLFCNIEMVSFSRAKFRKRRSRTVAGNELNARKEVSAPATGR
jgi:hypothetical protein